MRAAIFNPYLDTLGGGERYTLSFAVVLLKKGYKVDLQWKNTEILKLLEKRFGLNLDGVNIVSDIKRGEGYDLCFWVSDGSIPTLQSRKNILHFQEPFHEIGGKSLLNKMKLFRINKIVSNSKFTKKIVDKEFGVNSAVVYPPVSVAHIKPKRKENLIIYVGRFSQLKQSKRHDILVKAFKKMVDDGLTSWKFVLAGGAEVVEHSYFKKLKEQINGYPIEILESPDFKVLKELYGKARIFWSASGYKVDELKYPERTEHFGMTVVEAMSAGCTPVIYSAGGHKEIVVEGENGFLFSNINALISKTTKIMFEKGVYVRLSKQAKNDAHKFSFEKFEDAFSDIV